MKVFISWSGERSKAVAELLSEWIPCVIQAVKPWISSDIEKGSTWFKEITDALKDTSIGIICLTPENKDKPWILFESGALLSGLTEPRVCTFLIDLEYTDIVPPLSQFNHTVHLKADILKLFTTLNTQLKEEHKLEEKILKKAFNTYWPDFDEKFKKILTMKTEEKLIVKAKRSDESMMSEVLSTVRSLEQRLREKEQNNEMSSKGEYSNWFQTQKDKRAALKKAIDMITNSITNDGCPVEVHIATLRALGFSENAARRIYEKACLNVKKVEQKSLFDDE